MGCSNYYFDARKDHTIRINWKEQIIQYTIDMLLPTFRYITVRAPGEKIDGIGFLVLHVSGLLLVYTGVGCWVDRGRVQSHTFSCTPRRRPSGCSFIAKGMRRVRYLLIRRTLLLLYSSHALQLHQNCSVKRRGSGYSESDHDN